MAWQGICSSRRQHGKLLVCALNKAQILLPCQHWQWQRAAGVYLRECTSTARGPRPSGCVTVKARESSSSEEGSDLRWGWVSRGCAAR